MSYSVSCQCVKSIKVIKTALVISLVDGYCAVLVSGTEKFSS